MIRKRRGFTLIELMIALAVIGILAAVAFPSYKYQVKKSRRAAAQAQMMDIANREQQYLLANRSYAAQNDSSSATTFESSTGYSLPSEVSTDYTYKVEIASSPATFTITFTPKSTSPLNGDGYLTLDSNGTKKWCASSSSCTTW